MIRRLALLWLFLLLGPLPSARPAAFARVSRSEAALFRGYAQRRAPQEYFNGTRLGLLAKVDVGDARQRRLFGPWSQTMRNLGLTTRDIKAKTPRRAPPSSPKPSGKSAVSCRS